MLRCICDVVKAQGIIAFVPSNGGAVGPDTPAVRAMARRFEAPAAAASGAHRCLGCGAAEPPGERFMRCGVCQGARYCGRACQKADWKRHKPGCAPHAGAGRG